jgi:Insertion element 4 transposase N-terminal
VGLRADLFGARPTGTFEFPKYGFELARKLVKQLDQIQGIFQCYGGPLSCARAHGMRGIADKDHAILVPRRAAWDVQSGAGTLILLVPGTRDSLLWHGHSQRIVASIDPLLMRDAAEQIGLRSLGDFETRWSFEDKQLAHLLTEARITDYISLGVISRAFPRSAIGAVLEKTERASLRQRDLPVPVVVYYVDHPGAIYAVLLSRGVALSAGGDPSVGHSVRVLDSPRITILSKEESSGQSYSC